jgi:hypothetical protein
MQKLMTWQWQLTDAVNSNISMHLYDIDLFDVDSATILSLKNAGKFVVCYYSAGSYEEWRSDANSFPESCIGKKLEGWEGERWIDFTCPEILNIMASRLDLAISKGCDGVEPDNVDGYTQNSGFTLTYNDQITYNVWTSNQSHQRGLAVGLKNDIAQIPDLVEYYDFAVNEECHAYRECNLYGPFTASGKPVFNCEYEVQATSFEELCTSSSSLNLSTIAKEWNLNADICSCLNPESNYNCEKVLISSAAAVAPPPSSIWMMAVMLTYVVYIVVVDY